MRAKRGPRSSYCGFDASQDCIPIPHLPLPIVDLLQAWIDHLDRPSPNLRHTPYRRPWLRARQSPAHRSRGGGTILRGPRSLQSLQWLDILALILVACAFQPGDQVEAFHEFEVQDFAVRREGNVEFFGGCDVLGDRNVLFLPGEVDGAQINWVAGIRGDEAC